LPRLDLQQCLPKTGILRTFVGELAPVCRTPPELVLCAGLQALSAAVGRRACRNPRWGSAGDLNLYQVLVVDPQTAGHPNDVTGLLSHYLPEDTWIVDGPFAYGKVLTRLEKQPCVVFVPWDFLLELSAYQRRYLIRRLADSPPRHGYNTPSMSRTWEVTGPFASVFAVQDPAPFLQAVLSCEPESRMVDHWLMVFVGEPGRWGDGQLPTAEVDDRVRRVGEALLGLRNDLSAQAEREGCLAMGMSDGAMALVEWLSAECQMRRRAHRGWGHGSGTLATGAYRHLVRVSGLIQLSIDGGLTIGEEAASAAAGLIWHSMRGADALLGRGTPKVVEARHTRVYQILEERCGGSISRSELLRLTHLDADQLDRELAQLRADGVMDHLEVDITGHARPHRRRERQQAHTPL